MLIRRKSTSTTDSPLGNICLKTLGTSSKIPPEHFMLPFIKMLTGNLELLNYKHCTLWNSWRMKMPNLKHYYLAGSLTEINPVLKENLLYTKWRYKERWQVEMGFSSKSSCYCDHKICVCHYAIKSVACWLVENVQETGKRDPLITSKTESIPCNWVDGNMVSSPTESIIQYPELSSQSQAYNLLILLFNWMWRRVSANMFWFNMLITLHMED